MAYPSVSFRHSSGAVGLQPIGDTTTDQRLPLGTVARAVDYTYGEGEFIYLKGAASTAAGDLVCYDQKAGTTVRAVHAGSTSTGPCAVAMSANVASQYGWYQIGGSGPVNSGANTVAANAAVYLTSTASQIDDAVVTGDQIDGIITTAANSGGFTTCQLNRPNVSGLGGPFASAVTLTAPTLYSGTTGITAHAGGGQGSAVALTTEVNFIDTVVTAADSVVLPAAALGKCITVHNRAAANALAIFPVSGGAIDALGNDTAYSLAAGGKRTFWGRTATAWISSA